MKCLPHTSSLQMFAIAAALSFAVSHAEAGPPICSSHDLKHLCPAELDELFANGCIPTCPVGKAKGTVLLVQDAHSPKLRAKMMGTVWKGKYFHEDGTFQNRWLGFRAGGSHVAVEPSLHDGKPCLAMEYPSSSLVFANTRDELREIAPGLLLGRFYERCPCPKLRGYFVLKMDCKASREP